MGVITTYNVPREFYVLQINGGSLRRIDPIRMHWEQAFKVCEIVCGKNSNEKVTQGIAQH